MNKVEICGVNTAQLPILTAEESRRLLEQAHAGDESARQAFMVFLLQRGH